MKTVLALFMLSVLTIANAQNPLAGLPQPTRSQSGQFLVYGAPGANGPAQRPYALQTNTDILDLEPWLMAVSCERIKDVIWRELNVTKAASGKIFIFLYRAESLDAPITITPQQFAEGWSYRMDIPAMISQSHYLSAITHILLLELANRNASGRSAEIPLWLREGIAQQLLASSPDDLVPLIPRYNVNGMAVSSIDKEGRRLDPLAHAHAVFKTEIPLTFQELSWPSSDDLRGDPAEQFRASAQLFVARLLALRNGRVAMRTMIESLPNYYNWQFALLNAYPGQFTRILNVEKWWAINLVQFTGRDAIQRWTPEESMRKLAETIRPGIEVRTSTNQMPLHTDATLQTIIKDWRKTQREETLQRIVNELKVLKIRLSPEVVALANDYQSTLVNYLQNRGEFDEIAESKRRSSVSEAYLTRSTLKTLDTLDERRVSFRGKTKQPARVNVSASLDSDGNAPMLP